MGAIGHDGLAFPGQVILAHEPSFSLGVLSVHPATRQVTGPGGSETLEPRVMQVLVALYRANGIVTRDELLERCWDGRIVGDDAINRILSRIRRIAEGIGANSFKVETITKVGYRLAFGTNHCVKSPLVPENPSPSFNRRALIGSILATSSLGAIGAIALWQRTLRAKRPSLEPRSLYERAVALRYSGGPANNRQAIAYLREAVRIAPEYGEAWGVLAFAYRNAIEDEAPERVAGLEELLKEAALQAEKFDPGNADAAAAMLPTDSFFGHWSELESSFRDIIRRDPVNSMGYFALGGLFMEVGRWNDAVGQLRAAKARNAFSPFTRYKLVVSLWSAGLISAAEQEIDEAMLRWPQHGAIWQTKIKLLGLTGRAKTALALAKDATGQPLDNEPSGQNARLLFLTALDTRSAADTDKAVEGLTAYARRSEQDVVTMGLQCAALGRQQLALAMLEGAFLGTGVWAKPAKSDTLSTHPLFQPHAKSLWPEPRFNHILAAIGLEQYWRSSKTRPDYRRA